ncbi:glycoside hydrolase TIM-barrel-like domain-containing protein, partial [Rickettsiales bacterium]|nr:glycoside hydrolase TIM-barrel-like domain-containing protein [Rickettsiales bacterium]
MASIVLATAASAAAGGAASAAGASVATAAISASVGEAVGKIIGSQIDRAILGGHKTKIAGRKGPRLRDLAVQSSAYGEPIAILYGTARIAGNIIWARPINETEITSTSTIGGGKGGSPKVTQSQSQYNYSITLAIAICEGKIDDVIRVWADSKLINPNQGTYRLYKGTETQNVDPLIESFEGSGNTPAYRGLAYVVIEDFPLGEYGNRIPNFSFEVQKKFLKAQDSDTPVEELVKSITLIPGAGEFVYDDLVQYKIPGELVSGNFIQVGNRTRINENNNAGKADGLVALDKLEATFPNLEWVSIVVTWFGDDLDAGNCIIKPGVEYQTGATTSPDEWSVASFSRSTARQITLDGDGSPVYGGTPSDASLLRYIQEIKSRGINVMFYPMFFMDTENKPWRGRVTGSVSDVANFFNKTNGYNAFINHYANLVKDDVDAFVIGSELIGLTSVQDVSDDSFPAVDELVSLAATVKSTVGSVKVTYAADWSEYHHDANGWYNLDPLWASSNIDMVGIDAYFPLTDAPQSGYSEQDIIDGWTSGEGYDWYYSDAGRTTQTALSEEYAWKNIAWWWNNTHTNPDMSTTSWTPQMKKIWFTEYGYPSVDGAANQPNVFYDPNSSESSFPYHSKGRVDFRAQRTAISATEKKWLGSSMIERMFLWTWDARPFPFWPDLTNIWSDGAMWKTGHWVQGKMGMSSLAAIIADLCGRTGLSEGDIDVSGITDLVDGFVLNDQIEARDAIDILRKAYFFDAVESENKIKFVSRGGSNVASITEDDLLPQESGNLIETTRIQELELPQKIDVNYLNKITHYQTGNQHSQRLTTNSIGVETIGMPLVLSDQEAKVIADKSLFSAWIGRTSYSFDLPIKYARLEPTDIIDVTINGVSHIMRIVDTHFGVPGIVKIQAIEEDVSIYDFYNEPGDVTAQTNVVEDVGQTILSLMDLPALPSDSEDKSYLRIAVSGQEAAWKGSVVYRSDDDGANYQQLVSIESAATMGYSTTALADGPVDLFDSANSVTISLYGSNTLSSVTEIALLNGANTAKLGNEIIQFQTATLISPGKYSLTNLLRGRLGTSWAISGHSDSEEFILLDNKMVKEAIPDAMVGLSRKYKAVSVGKTLNDAIAEDFTYNALSLKPYAPVSISGTRDGSLNLTISWLRCTRINGQWKDYVDVPLGEKSEAYEVDIMSESTVIRTISNLSSETASYSASDQIADFGSEQASILVNIYQLSESVGRGYAGI